MGRIEITTETIELDFAGIGTANMLGDPSATPEFAALMDLKVAWVTKAQRNATHKGLLKNLSAMAVADEDVDVLASVPPLTLDKGARMYVQTVLGFPTQPAKPSGKP